MESWEGDINFYKGLRLSRNFDTYMLLYKNEVSYRGQSFASHKSLFHVDYVMCFFTIRLHLYLHACIFTLQKYTVTLPLPLNMAAKLP